jgi:hypothetical protein
MIQLLRSERAKPNRLPDQAEDACVPAFLKRLWKRANVQLLIDLAPLETVGAAQSLKPPLPASQPRTGDTSAAIQRP